MGNTPASVLKVTLLSNAIASVPRLHVEVNVSCSVLSIRHLSDVAANAHVSSFRCESRGLTVVNRPYRKLHRKRYTRFRNL